MAAEESKDPGHVRSSSRDMADNESSVSVSASANDAAATKELPADDKVAQFVAAHQDYPPMTPEMEKRIKRKIDAWIIPLGLFTATMAAVDKVQLGTAALYDFLEDNNLTGGEYSWLGSILSVGVCLYYPSFLFLANWHSNSSASSPPPMSSSASPPAACSATAASPGRR